MRLLDDKLAVQRIDPPKPEGHKESIIEIPDSAKKAMEEKLIYAKVIAVGKGKRLDNGERRPMEVVEGDTILLNKYGGYTIKDSDGIDTVILTEAEILAIL